MRRFLVCSSCLNTRMGAFRQLDRAFATIKPRVVIVGSGWAGYRLAQDIDKDLYDVHVVSPRNHFLFTPLLPSTAVGTLEFRAIQEPVRTIPRIHYYQSLVKHINFDKHTIHCGDLFQEGYNFDLPYDALLLAPGSESNTFNIQGVLNNPHVFFLRQLNHARAIRNRLIDCFERASSPATTDKAVQQSLLTFVVVGGGPTNIEFASELYDFLKGDVSRWYPELLPLVKVIVVEAGGHILGTFNTTLVSYVEDQFKRRSVQMKIHTTVTKIEDNVVKLSDGSEIAFGLLVWSTGIQQVPFIQQLDSKQVAKLANGRLKVDHWLRVCEPGPDGKPIMNGRVFALGDCAADGEKPLPALAQVASQQAQYLSKRLNSDRLEALTTAGAKGSVPPFKYAHLGSMASVGEWKGVFDSPALAKQQPQAEKKDEVDGLTGFKAFLLWRAAYWTKQVSLRNKILIPMYWFQAMIFGRDIARF